MFPPLEPNAAPLGFLRLSSRTNWECSDAYSSNDGTETVWDVVPRICSRATTSLQRWQEGRTAAAAGRPTSQNPLMVLCPCSAEPGCGESLDPAPKHAIFNQWDFNWAHKNCSTDTCMFLLAETFEILQEALVTHLSNTLQPQWQRRNWTRTEQSADVNHYVLKRPATITSMWAFAPSSPP